MEGALALGEGSKVTRTEREVVAPLMGRAGGRWGPTLPPPTPWGPTIARKGVSEGSPPGRPRPPVSLGSLGLFEGIGGR